ncbi:MAG: RNA-binding S4 domain-containing protein [Gemmatimonadota bacterium]
MPGADAARPSGKTRLDKWLWAARFYKTRSAATEAVQGGKIEVNGERPKPARTIQPGDEIRIRLGPFEHILHVTALADRRGSAAQAATLYLETEASRVARERHAEVLRLAPSLEFDRGRPGKKDRRALDKLRGR